MAVKHALLHSRTLLARLRRCRSACPWLLAALASACGGVAEPSGGDAAYSVVIGTGEHQYQPLDADSRVPLIRGIQGAYHIWSSFIAYGFSTDVLRMELTTSIDADPASLLEMPGNVGVHEVLDPDGTPGLASVGWPASIYDPTCADGRRLRFDLTVRDQTGHSASASQDCIVFVPAPYRSNDCGE